MDNGNRDVVVAGKCLSRKILLKGDREIIFCCDSDLNWKWNETDGYFLVRIQGREICVGYVDGAHVMSREFRGTSPTAILREIASRRFISLQHLAYIAAEIARAH